MNACETCLFTQKCQTNNQYVHFSIWLAIRIRQVFLIASLKGVLMTTWTLITTKLPKNAEPEYCSINHKRSDCLRSKKKDKPTNKKKFIHSKYLSISTNSKKKLKCCYVSHQFWIEFIVFCLKSLICVSCALKNV